MLLPERGAMNIPFFKRFKTYGPKMILDMLEERIVLDASVAPTDKNQDHSADASTGDHATQQTAATSTAPTATAPAANQATPATDPAQQVFNQDLHVVLISNALDQVAISKAVSPDAKVITYDGQKADISAIVNDLKSLVDSTGHKIEQLELLSYGQSGVLQLSENSLYSAYTVSSDPGAWQTLGSLLTANAKIDLFGCNIGHGADGAALVNTISSLTGSTVWASDNITGSGPNSDWVLETHSGESTLGNVLDASVLKTLNVTLDNSDMTNPGFETGAFTGWTLTQSTHLTVVNASTGGNYGGINVGPSPYAAFGSVDMALLSDNNGSGPWTAATMPKISQTFTYNTPDHLVFAYDMVTSDGYQSPTVNYSSYDDFGYKVSVTHAGVTTDVVNVLMHSGEVGSGTWQVLRDSGWQTVDLDLSQYAQIGDTIKVEFQCGNTVDAQYNSWMFVDMQKTAAQPPTPPTYLSTHGVLDVTVFEDAANTARNLDNIFTDTLFANSQITLSVSNNTNSSLFDSVSIDANHQLTLDYAPDAFGTAQITLHAVDPSAHALDYTFKVTVLPVDDNPTAANENYFTPSGAAIPVTVTGYDPDLDPISNVSFAVVTGPTHGTLSAFSTVTTDGNGNYFATATYTPTDSTYTGNDPFTYKMITPSLETSWKGLGTGTALSNETGCVQSMELTDTNNDGYPELVTAVSDATTGTGDTYNYYYSNTNGTFAAETMLGMDQHASRAIAVGDLDGDGHPDVVVLNGSNEPGRVYFWQNSGWNGTQFSRGMDLVGSGAGGGGAVIIADVNGDGLNDIVEGQAGGNHALIWYKNMGAHTFDGGHTIASNLGTISALAAGDFNNDGYLDMVVGKNAALTQVFRGNADGTFTSMGALANGSTGAPVTYSIAVGDVDGDGFLDIVEGNYSTGLAGVNKFYKGAGNFTFTESNISADQDLSARISLADVDHDGDLDVLVSNATNGTTYNKVYLFDNGLKTYTAAEVNIGGAMANCFASASGDVNKDGYMDFVVGQWNTGTNPDSTDNYLFTNQGINNLDSNIANGTIYYGAPITTTGVLDITVFEDSANTVRNMDNIIHSVLGNSQLTLSVSGDTNPGLFAAVSVDNPGHQLTLDYAPDAFGKAQITLHAVDPYSHTFDFTFNVNVLPVDDDPTTPATPATYYDSLGGTIPIVFTGHDPDLSPVSLCHFAPVLPGGFHGTLAPAAGAAGVLTEDSQGNFTQTWIYTPPDSTYVGVDTFSYTLTTPSGTWVTFTSTSGATVGTELRYTQDMALVDVNNDNFPELLTAITNAINTSGNANNGTGNAYNYFFLNTAGTFGTALQLGGDSHASVSIATGDLNRDGLPDVAVLNNGNNNSDYFYLSSWNGTTLTFSAGTTLSGSSGVGSGVIAIGDFNGDGRNDIIEGRSGGAVVLYKNLGNATFDGGTSVLTGLGTITALGVADLNNDGFLDLVVGRQNALTMVYSGDGDGTFTSKGTLPHTTAPTSLPNTYSIALGDVDGDQNVDIVVGNYGLNSNTGYNKFYRNTGNFTFAADSNITTDRDNTVYISLADVDLDGHLDVLVSNYGTTGTVNNKAYIFDNTTKTFDLAASPIGASGYNFYSSAVGDVNHDGNMDFVVGQWDIANTRTNDILYTNPGLNDKPSTDLPQLTIHNINLLQNPKFDGNYAGWYFETDNLPPQPGYTATAETYAILHPGDTVSLGQALLDYNSGISQDQYSFFLPITIPGTADPNNRLAVQLTEAPHHSWLLQDINMPGWGALQSMTLQFDIAYWNHLGDLDPLHAWHPGTQDLAVYVYDADNSNPQPLWIATQGVNDFKTHDASNNWIFEHKTFQLPTNLLGHKVVLAIEMSSLENFMEYAVDNFQITATFGTPTVYNPTLPTAPGLGSVFGPNVTDPILLPSHGPGGVLLPGMTGMSMVFAVGETQTSKTLDSGALSFSVLASSDLLLTPLDDWGAQTLVTTSTSLDTTATSTTTPSTTTDTSGTTYTAVTLSSPDAVQITPDPVKTVTTTTPDLLALALTPADTTQPQASLDDYSVTVAAIDNGQFYHDQSLDFHTTLVFNLDDVSPLHLLSLNAPVPINPLEMSEPAILGDRLSAGRSVTVSMDSMRFSDIFG
jgi:hypothetical protein